MKTSICKRTLALVLALVFIVSLCMTGCGKTEPDAGPVDDNVPEQKADPVYTYNEYIAKAPVSWNAHIGESDADSYVQLYTEMGLYAITLAEDKENYCFVDEMAVGDPSDVTANYVEQYGISEGDAGKAWEIKLNPDAVWANGEAITSEDYVWSMEQLLNTDMRNRKATAYYSGESALYKAKDFYMNNNVEYAKIPVGTEYSDDELAAFAADGKLFFSLSNIPFLDQEGTHTLSSYHALAERQMAADATKTTIYSLFFADRDFENGTDITAALSGSSFTENIHGYVPVTAKNIDAVKEALGVFTANIGALGVDAGNWYNLCAITKTTATEYTKVTQGTEYTDDEIKELVASGTLYFGLDKIPFLDEEGTHTLTSYHGVAERQMEADAAKTTIYSLFFPDRDFENGTDITETLGAFKKNINGYVKITEENFEIVKEALGVFTANIGGLGVDAGNWYQLCAISSEVEIEETTFDEIGIFATGDLSFVLVFENAQSLWDVKNLLCTNWIVYRPYYEEGCSYVGELKVSNYGTPSGQYMAYGPYVLDSYQTDKELVFARNDNWYGYQPGKTNYHEGQYQTTRIVSQIIEQQSTALLEFEKGNLDQVRLASTDLDKYKFSDYLLTRTGGNIWQIAFNSDAEKLAGIEADGQGNRRVLSIPEFRRGLSLSLNRSDIGRNIMVGSKPAYSFINDNYYYDMENNIDSIYRNTDAAKQAIVDLYNVGYGSGETYATLDEAYQSITGYDITEATECFKAAYEYAVTNGLYADGEKVQINIYNNTLTAALTALGEYMQAQVNQATVGTGFEGKVTISVKAQESGRLEAIRDGNIEAVYYSRISDYNNPYGLIGSYVDSSKETLLECGFDPSVATLSLTFDFNGDGAEETVENTYLNWQLSTIAGGAYAGNVEARLYILARLENALLSGFRTLPICVGTDVLLYSQKVEYATTDANTFAAYGGIRLMSYNYDDAAWAEYCAGGLSYE